MPELSRFLGIAILMYFNDHNPPHFHVKYNEYRANMHRIELFDDWELLRTTGEYRAISPLV